ncbi:hypothetical protein FQR65_LT13906 [Abscondita terminalis]|nr:hypothetical protein FQR65_LT13906 [Abscondita terminalis]
MAKSLRKLEQLKKTILNDPLYKEPNDVEIEDAPTEACEQPQTTSDLTDIITIVDKKTMKRSRTNNSEEESMETNERKFNPKTMKDQYGSYPIWMNQRRIHEKKNLARANEKKKKKLRRKGKR